MGKQASSKSATKNGEGESGKGGKDGRHLASFTRLIERIEGDEGTIVFSPPLEARIEWDGEFYEASALGGDILGLDKSPITAVEQLKILISAFYFRYRNLPDEKLGPLARRIRDGLITQANAD